ncbi:Flp pilus assembly protein CpaB [Cypionkella sp.]|uniref:Flp pilus assembly protein CpaB n=1 Tax=Cypionkella sp. TaxID=2811411 RepID=UPI0037509038
MRMIFGLVLAVGLALASAAVYVAQGYLNDNKSALQQEAMIRAKTGGLVEIFVVNKQKDYGDVLTPDDVQPMYWPQNTLPEGAFFHDYELFPESAAGAPRFVQRQMEQFEPILAVNVTAPGEQVGLNGSIAKGERAFAIEVKAADFLQPGDRVDVYWTGSVPGVEGDMTRLIESRLKIIAGDRSSGGMSSGGEIQNRTVTVAVSPEQVGRLVQAQATGRLVMSLVGHGDETATGKIDVTTQGLLGIVPAAVVAAPVAPAPEKTCSIKTRKGAEVIETPIPCTD